MNCVGTLFVRYLLFVSFKDNRAQDSAACQEAGGIWIDNDFQALDSETLSA